MLRTIFLPIFANLHINVYMYIIIYIHANTYSCIINKCVYIYIYTYKYVQIHVFVRALFLKAFSNAPYLFA